jgi:sugar/nucleoside kinase (ribokinase family)
MNNNPENRTNYGTVARRFFAVTGFFSLAMGFVDKHLFDMPFISTEAADIMIGGGGIVAATILIVSFLRGKNTYYIGNTSLDEAWKTTLQRGQKNTRDRNTSNNNEHHTTSRTNIVQDPENDLTPLYTKQNRGCINKIISFFVR